MKQKSFHQINEGNHDTNFLITSKIKNGTFCIPSNKAEFGLCLEKELFCDFTLSRKISQNWRRYE